MRIWLLNPYGPLPSEGWRDYRFTHAARALSRRGHEVIWWTARFAHHSKQQRDRVSTDAFKIELIPTPSFRRNIGAGRLWFEYAFSRRMMRVDAPRPDVIIAADPPQFCGAAGRRLAKRFGVPLVIDCLDLWPELFVRLSPAPLKPIVRVLSQPLYIIRRRNLRAAALTITAANAYSGVVAREGAQQVMTIPIGVDLSLFESRSPQRRDGFTVVYAGTLGEGYDLTTVMEAFRMLASENIRLVIAGKGPAETRLKQIAPKNVAFAGMLDLDRLRTLYRDSDIGLISYSPDTTVAAPVKMFDYIAAGLPVVTSIDIPFADVAARYRVGSPESLRDVLRELSTDRTRLEAMGAATLAVRAEIDAQRLYERYADAVEVIAGR